VCAAAAGFACVTAMAIAESSTTGAIAACMSCLLCRGLFFYLPTNAACAADAGADAGSDAAAALLRRRRLPYAIDVWAGTVQSCERGCRQVVRVERVKHARCDGFVQELIGCIEVLLFPDHCLRCSLTKLTMTWSGRVDARATSLWGSNHSLTADACGAQGACSRGSWCGRSTWCTQDVTARSGT
jgi:hypothetical protein